MAQTPDLEAQVAKLQGDIKTIMHTLTQMGEDKVGEVRSAARSRAHTLADRGRAALEGAEDEFGAVEKQIKDTIREKPLTAVAGAIALGFLLALITR
ncbi:MAG: DNA gyrase subunit B [Devosia sp.]|nr:DNA gyrase subunit B [Devosia sp.]